MTDRPDLDAIAERCRHDKADGFKLGFTSVLLDLLDVIAYARALEAERDELLKQSAATVRRSARLS